MVILDILIELLTNNIANEVHFGITVNDSAFWLCYGRFSSFALIAVCGDMSAKYFESARMFVQYVRLP